MAAALARGKFYLLVNETGRFFMVGDGVCPLYGIVCPPCYPLVFIPG